MSDKYILDESGNPVPAESLHQWAVWFENNRDKRQLRKDELPDNVRVSTVFLGLDHGFGHGPPVLWETMIFGGPHDSYQDRYTSKADALAGHDRALKLAKGETEEAA